MKDVTAIKKMSAELRKEINLIINECKSDCKRLSEYDHDRIECEGKIYAYEFVRDYLLHEVSQDVLFDIDEEKWGKK